MKLNTLKLLAAIAALGMLLAIGAQHACAAPQPVMASQTTTADIDAALVKGPVFLEFETQSCGYCKQQHPISEGLARNYPSVTFMFVDASENRNLASQFGVSGVPQMSVISQKTGDGYTYVDKDGKATGNMESAKFMGLTQADALKNALDAAVRMRG